MRLEHGNNKYNSLIVRDFNSIKVRLELCCRLGSFFALWFQFHKGAIRTEDRLSRRGFQSEFQFHKGAIRTALSLLTHNALSDFNSIKVRLERPLFGLIGIIIPLFQFHKGAIRTCTGCKNAARLHRDFNSIKVRLEQPRGVCWLPEYAFQFHKGAIRTRTEFAKKLQYVYFNSIKVRLELQLSSVAKSYYEFQFHKGAIRTINKKQSALSKSDFNSIKVRLEPRNVCKYLLFSCISIP